MLSGKLWSVIYFQTETLPEKGTQLPWYHARPLPLQCLALERTGRGTLEGWHLFTGTDPPRGRSAFYALADYWVEVLLEGEEQRIAEVVPFRTGDRLERML